MKVRDKFLAIEREMTASWLERREEIRGLLVGLIARQHVLLLGPPGTAKSAIAEDLCGRIGGSYFRWLLSRTSTPEELFGPISIRALEQDSYRRVTTGKLPEAHVAFLDEIWKCNSAVLNSLLTVLNERLFFNDGQPVSIPLQLAVGASNELPEDREELGALFDRFLLRYVVSYIREPRNFEAMLAAAASAQKTTVTLDELAEAQAEAEAVDVTHVIPMVATLRARLLEQNITVSDRRWKQSLAAIKAYAWLEGRTAAMPDDLAILAAILWQEPEQIMDVRKAVLELASPIDLEAQDLLDQAEEIARNALNAEEVKMAAAGSEANAKLRRIKKQLEALKNKAQEAGRSTTRLDASLARVEELLREVVAKCLGLDL